MWRIMNIILGEAEEESRYLPFAIVLEGNQNIMSGIVIFV